MRHRWTVALVNDNREIDRIKERIFSQLSPVDDLIVNYESSIPYSNGLQCYIFSFSSGKGCFQDSSKIYDSNNFSKDRDLRDVDESKLEKYIQRVLIK
jgi:hypothetical protein